MMHTSNSKPTRPGLQVADPYRVFRTGFDLLAPNYDEEIGGNAVSERMREVFQRALAQTFDEKSFLFEIGCGTGIDALWLARRGASVVATDISVAMIDQLKRKAAQAGVAERIRVRRLAAAEIGELARDYGEGAFDGGYSHAGALNMEPEISAVAPGMYPLLRPGGRFVCSVINKTSLYELLFYLSVLHPRKAFRRLGNVVPVPLSRNLPLSHEVVPARFYSGAEMARIFGGRFELRSMRGLQVFLPPANLADGYARARIAFRALERLEDRTSGLPFLRMCGNHTILVFRRA